MTKPKQPKLTKMTEAQALERLAKVSKPVRYPPLTGKSAEMLFEFMAQAKAEGPRFTGFRKPPLDDYAMKQPAKSSDLASAKPSQPASSPGRHPSRGPILTGFQQISAEKSEQLRKDLEGVSTMSPLQRKRSTTSTKSSTAADDD